LCKNEINPTEMFKMVQKAFGNKSRKKIRQLNQKPKFCSQFFMDYLGVTL